MGRENQRYIMGLINYRNSSEDLKKSITELLEWKF